MYWTICPCLGTWTKPLDPEDPVDPVVEPVVVDPVVVDPVVEPVVVDPVVVDPVVVVVDPVEPVEPVVDILTGVDDEVGNRWVWIHPPLNTLYPP